MSEDSVKLKNAELTLISIRQDTITAASELTLKRSEKKMVEEGIELAKAQFLKEISAFREEIAILKEERNKVVNDSDRSVVLAKNQLKVLEGQIKAAMSELGRLNDWIMKAESNKSNLNDTNITLERNIADSRLLVKDIEVLRRDKAALVEENNTVKMETTLMLDDTQVKLRDMQKLAKEAESSRKDSTSKREKEEIAVHELLDYRVRVNEDIEIYIKRIEAEYKKAFPHLRMKLI